MDKLVSCRTLHSFWSPALRRHTQSQSHREADGDSHHPEHCVPQPRCTGAWRRSQGSRPPWEGLLPDWPLSSSFWIFPMPQAPLLAVLEVVQGRFGTTRRMQPSIGGSSGSSFESCSYQASLALGPDEQSIAKSTQSLQAHQR